MPLADQGARGLCYQTLPLVQGKADGLDVAIEDFEDRLEIVVEHHGAAQPSLGMDSFIAECARQLNVRVTGARLMLSVDRVEYDARNGSIRTTLVKYLRSGGKSSGKSAGTNGR